MMAARSLAWLQHVGRALSVIYEVFLSSFVYFVVFFGFKQPNGEGGQVGGRAWASLQSRSNVSPISAELPLSLLDSCWGN